jgi:hypothetical protein
VQHSGLSVDGGSVPTWVTMTGRLIAHVVDYAYAYGMDIDDVRLSTAIHDPAIKAHFDAAESHLAADNPTDAMKDITGAYKLARDTWNRFVESGNMSLRGRPRPYSASWEGDDGDQIEALQRVTFLTSISPDPAEAIWFLAALREKDLLTAEEARRALAFTFTFATAVEASPAARRQNRRIARDEQARHVRTDPTALAYLGSFSLYPDGWRGIAEVTLALVDVPDTAAFDEWNSALSDLLNPRGISGSHIYVKNDGRVLFYADSDVTSTLTRIAEAVVMVDDVYEAARAEKALASRHRLTELEEIQDRLRGMMTDDVPSWIRLEAIAGWRLEEGPEVVLALNPALRRDLGYQDVLEVVHGLGGIGLTNSSRGFVIQAEPDALPALLTVIVPALEDLKAREQMKEGEAAARADAVRHQLLGYGLRPL